MEIGSRDSSCARSGGDDETPREIFLFLLRRKGMKEKGLNQSKQAIFLEVCHEDQLVTGFLRNERLPFEQQSK
jgi:hypothetical protein